ncbi:hypothetical protein [uncultured Paracoccus sp.]|uniref:hypothetical protein n=1 Tax=uncultured Paracoccus sp. TaxID=189685 RepID=UPI00260240A9|nr:hypothetical protein [uncultured Paracoccus sp.]
MVSLNLHDPDGVQRRLQAFLVQFTAPQWVTQTQTDATIEDLERAAEVLDLVLDILLDAQLGLVADLVPADDEQFWHSPRRLHAPETGAQFDIRVGARGGYDLRVTVGNTVFADHAMSFEALTMALRSFAALHREAAA